MNVEFKFNIGDRVRHKAHGGGSDRARHIVIERLTHECHGGTQIIYRLRDGIPGGYAQAAPFVEVTEPELLPDRPYCEGCAYGVPVIAAPGMATGFAHVDERSRQVCTFSKEPAA